MRQTSQGNIGHSQNPKEFRKKSNHTSVIKFNNLNANIK